jgi:hypothetical protein
MVGMLCTDLSCRFRIAVSATSEPDTGQAMQRVMDGILAQSQALPDFLTLHYGSAHSAQTLQALAVGALPGTALHGGSSCLGVMTAQGPVIDDGAGMGALAIWDPDGAYGTALAPAADDPRQAARAAVRSALIRAGRPGEAPDLVWLTSPPGHEELVMAGIKDVLGPQVLIVGGSSADNDAHGAWSQLGQDGATSAGIVISVLFPSVPVAQFFDNGYAPTEIRGRITQSLGRKVQQIDGRAASVVYAEWTNGAIPAPETGSQSVLLQSTLFPLGRELGRIGQVPYHLLAHPSAVHADGQLELFAELQSGEGICLMTGTIDTLIQRAGHIAELTRGRLPASQPSGALVIYCGGCMLSVQDRLDEVTTSLSQALPGMPFLGLFSFGEQGETVNGTSEHGNLMISCLVFGSSGNNGSPVVGL